MTASHCNASIVVPVYNAAATLAETLASVCEQTFPSWEAVIVDDGSTDDTAAIAWRWVDLDPRFRLVRQKNAGVSSARNAGVRAARAEWLVFLDSDDWLAPACLELAMRRAGGYPTLDAIVYGCVRVSPSGEHGPPAIYDAASFADAFPQFAVDCPLAIHNCAVRRALVQSVGGFDTGLSTNEDWDFWQRIARAGARFGVVPEALAFYRMRPDSRSTCAQRALLDGWTVIRRAHARDPRVRRPDPRYADGMPPAGLPEALYRQAVWAASIMLSQGNDARPLIALMGDERAPSLAPERVAHWLFEYVPFARSEDASAWPALWPKVAERLRAYLSDLEAQAGASGLALRCERALESLIAQPG